MRDRESLESILTAKTVHWEAKKRHTPPPQQVQILLCLFIACQTGTINTKLTVYTGVSLYHPSSVQMVEC